MSNLHDVTECGTLSVQGAFGISIQPSKRGKLGPLGLDAIVIDGMGHQTLVSLSQYCQGGDSGVPHVGVFTGTDFRMSEVASTLPAIKLFSEIGIETTVAPSGSATPFSRLDAISTLEFSCSQLRLLVTS